MPPRPSPAACTPRPARSRPRDEAPGDEPAQGDGHAPVPLRPSEHLALLARAGFALVELVWRAYGQAGFLAMVPGASEA
jgi:hypothetical protein